MLLREKADCLRQILQSYGRVALAFSGGVDSSLLLKCSLETLGAGNVLVLHNRSDVQKSSESELAVTWLKRHGLEDGVEVKVLEIQPLEWKEFVLNPPDRCYLCKRRLYSQFAAVAQEWGAYVLIDGTNTDDLRDTRPGLRAIHELGVKTPFVQAGLNKEDIRQMSRDLDLDTWNRPSGSCLATRIPFGVEITRERLRMIEQWEEYLRNMEFRGCRVRLADEGLFSVHVQVREGDIEKISSRPIRFGLLHYFRNQGVGKVYLDLAGR